MSARSNGRPQRVAPTNSANRGEFLLWCCSPRCQNHSCDIPTARFDQFPSGLLRRHLRPAEVAAPGGETPIILRLVAKGCHVIIEICIELRNDLLSHRLRKRVQCQRSLRLAAVTFAIGLGAAIELLDARPVA